MPSIVLIEDDPGVRNSLAAVIDGFPGHRCVAAYPDAESALAGLGHSSPAPDVALVDLQLPRMDGVECVRRLKALVPGLPIVILTVHSDETRVFAALAAGAVGYLLKRTPPGQLIEAITEACAGGAPMTRDIARRVVSYFHGRSPRDPNARTSPLPLTGRELQVLERLSRGLRYKEIADQLGISLDTVRDHLRRIYDKLQVSSRTEAVVKYLGR